MADPVVRALLHDNRGTTIVPDILNPTVKKPAMRGLLKAHSRARCTFYGQILKDHVMDALLERDDASRGGHENVGVGQGFMRYEV